MSSDSKISTLIIDDSSLMRIMISDALKSDHEITVVDTARDGKEGVEKVKKLQPDVVVTDMVMPEYDGVYVVDQVMKESPRPIFLLSSVGRTNSDVFEALNRGAVDFVDKPDEEGKESFDDAIANLIRKIKVTISTRSKLQAGHNKSINHAHTFSENLNFDILAIGASTGGPSAIEDILSRLPTNLTIPVVVAQHMPERFLKSFAERLAEKIDIEVRIPENNEVVRQGVIYLAPGTVNLKIIKLENQTVFSYTNEEYTEFNNPSINCLFESINRAYPGRAIATLLTGMGKDGAQGIKKIKQAGGLTIGQDEDSCVVYGMPAAAKNLQALTETVKLKDIPGFIVSSL